MFSAPSLFDEEIPESPEEFPPGTVEVHRILITVKAAPNPSVKSGETVCVAGIRIGPLGPLGWIRLYPLNLRNLPAGTSNFKKYDIISVACRRASDARRESWTPNITTLRQEKFLPPWKQRRPLVDPMVRSSMCELRGKALEVGAPSLGLVAAATVSDLVIERHPGWSREEKAKIDAYVNQISMLPGDDRSPLEAPRFKGFYQWKCLDVGCRGHRQQILDWEFVAFQRHLWHASDERLRAALRERFLEDICLSGSDLAFYVGNQAKRHQTFSILGAYYPGAG